MAKTSRAVYEQIARILASEINPLIPPDLSPTLKTAGYDARQYQAARLREIRKNVPLLFALVGIGQKLAHYFDADNPTFDRTRFAIASSVLRAQTWLDEVQPNESIFCDRCLTRFEYPRTASADAMPCGMLLPSGEWVCEDCITEEDRNL